MVKFTTKKLTSHGIYSSEDRMIVA